MKATITVEIPDSLSNLLTSTRLVDIVRKAVENEINHPEVFVTKTTKEK